MYQRLTSLGPTILILVFLSATAGFGQGIVDLEISGNRVTAEISLTTFEADLILEFENAVGLSASNLGMSAEIVSVSSLQSRLPASVTSLAAGFPIVLTIEPPSTGGLSFSGVYTLELYTYDLTFTAGCPFRLFKSDDGGPFYDVTSSMGTGSYRVRSQSPTFSEFAIISDARSTSDVVDLKFDRLADLLDEHESAMPSSVHASLTGYYDDALAAWGNGSALNAISELDAFYDEVVDHSGTDIPDTWRSSRDLVNAAGELRAAAKTLRFSLALVP